MNIAFLGNFRHPHTSESHYLQTLRDLGHVVYPLQEGTDNINQIMARATKMDMFFWVHTHGWHTAGIELGLKKLKELGIPTVGYHLDLWLGLEREKDLATDPYWNIEHFFTVDALMAEYLNQHDNMPKGYYLPAGVFGKEAYMAKRTGWKHDVVFVGTGVYHKEWTYRHKLIEWLDETYGDKFAHYGIGGKPAIRNAELNQLYADSKIVIGDTLCKDFKYPYYLSDRIFETTGRGGFIIHPYIEGMEDLFNLGGIDNDYFNMGEMEVATYDFGNFEYLKYAIDYFLHNEDEREAIRLRGHERTKNEHTYHHRLSYILETIQNGKSGN